jgi:hypothetical protein
MDLDEGNGGFAFVKHLAFKLDEEEKVNLNGRRRFLH